MIGDIVASVWLNMSLLRHSTALVRRILVNNAKCSVQVQQRKYGDDSPSGYDFTHLEGKGQVDLLDLDDRLTAEKRAELAAKYNLRPEDYIPLNDSDLTMGDYPKLPIEHCLERDAYYDWDDPYHRINYGEPIFHELDFYQPMFGVDRRPLAYDRPQMWKYFATWLGIFVLFSLLGEKFYYFPQRSPKQYPEVFPMDGLKKATYYYDYLENRWTGEAKVKERYEVANYAFPKGWDPLAH